MGGVVERLVDDALDGDAGVAGDLGAQFVARAPGGGGDVGLGASLELGHLGVDADPAVGDQRLGLGFGLGVEAVALGLDVALGPADVGRLGLGGDLRRRRIVEFLLDPGGAIVEALLDRRPRVLPQQAEDDQRREPTR